MGILRDALRARAKPGRILRRPSLHFETLEPRLLLSAHVLQIDPSHMGGNWTLEIDTATRTVEVLDQQKNGAVIGRYSASASASVQVEAAQNDHVLVDFSSSSASTSSKTAGLSWLQVDGQAGDTLAASGAKDQWVVEGQGAGTLNGLAFSGFTALQVAPGSQDTFAWEPSGPLTMSIAGYGSGDTLSIEGNDFQNVAITASGPQSGTVAIDGSSLAFTGFGGISIDPIDAEKQVVANVTVTAPAADDNLVLKTATPASKLTVESLKNSSPSITFYRPSESLTLNATGGGDTITVDPLSMRGASLTVNATTGNNSVTLNSIDTSGGALTVDAGPPQPLGAVFDLNDTVTVNAGATIETRKVDSSGVVRGDAGSITLSGTDIDLQNGSALDASADGPYKSGDVTLTASYQVIATGFVLDTITNNFVPRAASITLGANASIEGGAVNLAATAGDQSIDGLVNGEPGGFNFMKPLENFASFLTLPVSVLGKASDAEIDIGAGAAITATGALNIDATAQSLATGNAIYWFSSGSGSGGGGVAVVYDETDATANVNVAAGARLTAGGDASIISDATSKATGIARVSQNVGTFPTNPQNVQLSVAVGLADIVSHVTVAQGASIISGGNVAVRSLGVSGNTQTAETASYNDGLAGIDGTLVFTENDVKATVDGTIIAQGAPVPPTFTFNPFSAVDPSTGVFNLGNVAGIQTGDAFTYSSGLGGAIGGLTDGQVYYAIRIPGNSTSIELAATAADAIAGKAIQLQPDPTITTASGGQSFVFTNVDEGTNALELGQDASSLYGKEVVYHAVAGQNVGGLVNGKTYLAVAPPLDPNNPETTQEVQLVDPSTGLAPVLDINPTVTTASGQSFDFSVDETPDDLVFSADPGFARGQALVYTAALGFQIDGLASGETYYAIPVPNEDGSPGTDPTRFRLAATEDDALSSDGYTNVIDISTDDSSYQSGDAHTLTPVAVSGINVASSLTTFDKAITKSGIGSEPKLRDAITKGELAPAFTNILANLGNIVTPGKSNPIESNIKNNTPAGSGSNTNFTLSAGLAFLTADNNVTAEIGSNAVLESGTNVSVTATISHKMQTAVEGRISKSSDSAGSSFAVGGAASITIDTDDAEALVDSGAQIDAADAVSVTSDVEFPFLVALGSPDEYGQSLLDKLQADPLGTIGSFVGRTLFIQDQFVNAWTRATGKNPEGGVSVAGAVDFEDLTTNSQAIVGAGALINQNPALQNPAQSVAVNALTDLNRVDVSGIFDIELSPDGLAKARRKSDPLVIYQPAGTQGETGGLGGAFDIIDYEPTTIALIGDGAKVTVGADGSLSVGSVQDILAVELLQSGAQGGTFGVAGALDYFTETSDTQASIGSGVTITAPTVNVDAVDQSFLFSLSGSVFKGGTVGFGLSATVFDVEATTLAYVGHPTSNEASNLDLGRDGTLSVDATTTGTVVGLAFAAGIAGSAPQAPGGESEQPAPDAGQGNPGVSTGSFGLSVSGAVALSLIDETTQAVIDDPGRIIAGSVDVDASNDSFEFNASGAAALTNGSDGSTNIGLAGAYSEVDLSGVTGASINRATIRTTGAVVITADRSGQVVSLAAGGSGVPRYSGVATAGSVTINRMSQDTSATLENASVDAGGAVTLSSVDALSMTVVAGALSFGGRFGFGAAVAYNFIDSSIRSQVIDSAIAADGVSVHAARGEGDAENPQPQIIAIAASLGAGGSTSAAGTVAVNFIQPSDDGDGVEAAIAGSTVATNHDADVSVTADGDQSIVVIAGGVVASKQAGFGAAVAYNEITAPVVAAIDGGSVEAAGGVEIIAEDDSRISSVALGVVITGQNPAAAGSASANTIAQPVDATIEGGATLASDGPVTVKAVETSAIDGLAGSAAFAPLSTAFGAAIVTNTLANAVAATVDDADAIIRSSGSLTVEALSENDQITAVAAGGAGSSRFAAGGSVAVNLIESTTFAALENGATVSQAGSVVIHAGEANNQYVASAGAIAAAKSTAIGAAVATNDLATTVAAEVRNASTDSVNPIGKLAILADRSGAFNFALAVGGAGAETFALGGSSATEQDRSAILAEASNTSSFTKSETTLTAADNNGQNNVAAGSVAGAKTAAIGAAVAVADLTPVIQADVGGGSSLSSNGTFRLGAEQIGEQTTVLAVGGDGAQNFSAGGSVATVVSAATVEGQVDGGASVAAQSISVAAQQIDESVDTGAGAVAGAQSAAVGAAVAVNDLADQVVADISGALSSTRSGGGNTTVAADVSSNSVSTIALGGAGAQGFALGGSVAVTNLARATEALVGTGAQINAESVAISANSALDVDTIAGAIAGAGAVSIGVGNATLNSEDTTVAYVGSAQIAAHGSGAGIDAPTAVDGALAELTGFEGLSVTAVAADTLLTAALGGAGSGTASVAGSASVTLLDETTTATLGTGAGVDPANVNVLASNTTDLIGAGGALAGSGAVGSGGGIDTADITKDTEASILAVALNASGDIFVQALSTENVVSGAGAGGFAGAVGIAGSGSVQLYDLRTVARVGDDATPSGVTAQGSVQIAANDETDLNQFAGGLGVGGGAGLGASAAVSTINKSTLAYIGAGSSVTALGLGSGEIAAATGGFDVTYVAPSGNPNQVQPPNVSISLAQQTKDSTAGAVNDPGLTKEWVGAADYAPMKGVAVTATNQDDIQSFTFSAGGAGVAALLVAGAVDVVQATTEAYIGAGASVNANAAGSADDDSVRVAAGSNYHRLGITGAGAVGGVFGAAPAADVSIVGENTEALVSGAVEAKQDVTINAAASEDILAIAAGLAASGIIALDAGAAVVSITDGTLARIGDGVTVRAGGNVLLSATDTSTVLDVVGIGAIGLGGAGASAGIVIIDKSTEALVGANAVVDALGYSPNTIAYPDGNSTSTPFDLARIRGLVGLADSTEDVTSVSVAGVAGLYAGVAGGVTVTLISSDTTADVDPGAQINAAEGASAAQSVGIVAANAVKTVTVGGGFGGGAVGIAGGIDVGVIRNNVTTTVSGNVAARGSIDVLGVSNENVTSYAVSAAGGLVGVAGAVSMWTLGAGFNSNYSDTSQTADALKINDSAQYGSFITYADDQTNRTDILGLLGNYKNDGGGTDNTAIVDAIVAGAAAEFASEQPNNAVKNAAQNTSTSGVRVNVTAGANLNAGYQVRVNAAETVNAALTVGGGGVGAVGIGGSVGILNAGRVVEATLDGGASANGAVLVLSDAVSNLRTTGFGGGAGLVGIGAQAAVMTDQGVVSAALGGSAVITKASNVEVRATHFYQAFTARAVGGAVGAIAAGAAIARATVGGAVEATVSGASIGTLANTQVGSLNVSASFGVEAVADATASAAGIGAGAGNVANSTIAPNVTAVVFGDPIAVSGNLTVRATSNARALSVGKGAAAGGIAVAVSQNTASIGGTDLAFITSDGSQSALRAANVVVNATNSDQALVNGVANAGRSLIGVVGVASSATVTSSVQAFIANLKDFVVTGNVEIVADEPVDRAVARAEGVNQPALSVGVSQANVTVTPSVRAFLVNGAYNIGGSLRISSGYGTPGQPSSTLASATAFASVGGLPAGTDTTATALATVTPTVLTAIGAPDSPTVGSSTSVSAANDVIVFSWAASNAEAIVDNRGNGFFVANGNGFSRATINQRVQSWAGGGVSVSAGGTLSFTADGQENAVARTNVGGNSLIPTMVSIAETQIGHSATVTVGPDARLKGNQVDLRAYERPTERTNSAAEGNAFASGDGARAEALTSVTNNDWAGSGVQFLAGASVDATWLRATAIITYNLANDSYADFQAFTGFTDGVSRITTNDSALVNVGPGVKLTGTNSVLLSSTIQILTARSHTHTFLGVAIGTNDLDSIVELSGQAAVTKSGSPVITTPSFFHSASVSGDPQATGNRDGYLIGRDNKSANRRISTTDNFAGVASSGPGLLGGAADADDPSGDPTSWDPSLPGRSQSRDGIGLRSVLSRLAPSPASRIDRLLGFIRRN